MAWTDAERDEFYRRMTILAETLAEPMTPGRLAGYAAALDDVPAGCVGYGIEAAMRECRWFPKPVELRELGERSKPWKRLQEAQAERVSRRYLAPPLMSDEEMAANIKRLKAAVGRLSAGKRMR